MSNPAPTSGVRSSPHDPSRTAPRTRLLPDGGTARSVPTEPREVDADADDTETVEEEVEATVEEQDPLSLDVVFEVAKNERRRHTLRYLRDADEPVSLSELAEHIAAWENDKTIEALTSAERKRVYVGLYQCHLPKMDGADIVDFDRNSGITLGENAEEVLAYLDVDGDPERRWNTYYLALSVTGVLLFGLSLAGGGPLVARVLMGTFVVAVAVVAVFHMRSIDD